MCSLFRTLGLAIVVALANVVAVADEKAPAAPSQPVSLIGLTREEVIAVRGKPSGERGRADSRLMVYPDGTKIELRDGFVVSVSGGAGAEIVSADGTRYVPGPDGNIQRPVESIDPGARAAGPAADAAAVEAPSARGDATPATAPVDDADLDLPAVGTAPSSTAAKAEAALLAAENAEADSDAEAEELPPVLKIVAFLIEALLRLGLTVVVLRLALHFMGVPFFWPDLLKVAVLYLAVHEVVSGLGELGGWWEFIPIFRLQEIISFIILACSLTWFKIAGNGITALRIAVATKIVVVVLMLGVGLAVALVLALLH